MKEIQLTRKKVALVDNHDFHSINKYMWSLSGCRRYAVRDDENGRRIYMHREIMKTPVGVDVDHIDGDGLNNRRKNMRNCTRSQNHMNRKAYTFKKHSRFKGVTLDKSAKKKRWMARIKKDRKNIHIGRFLTEIEASKAYDKKAIELFGKFARING